MFARFRNLFSKNKAESESEVEVESSGTVATSPINASAQNEVNDSNEAVSQLEGLNLLKSLVETEKKSSNVSLSRDLETSEHVVPSLSQEVAEVLKNKLSNYNANMTQNEEVNGFNEALMITAEISGNAYHVDNGDSMKLNGTHDMSALPIESENSTINSLDSSELTVIHNKNTQLSEIENTADDLNSPLKSIEISNNVSDQNESLLENTNELNEINSEIVNNDGISLDQSISENSTEIESLQMGTIDEETTTISDKNVIEIERSSVQLTDIPENNKLKIISESDNEISNTETETKEIPEPKSNIESVSNYISHDYKESKNMSNGNEPERLQQTETPLNELTIEKILESESNDIANESSSGKSSSLIENQTPSATPLNELTTEISLECNNTSNDYKDSTNMSNENESDLESSTENSSSPIESQPASETTLNGFTTEKIQASKSYDISNGYKDPRNMSNENDSELESSTENSSCPIESQTPSATPLNDLEIDSKLSIQNDIVNEILQDIITEATKIDHTIYTEHIQSPFETISKNSHENSPEFSESSQTSSMISVKENNASSTSLYPTTDSETNLSNNSSIVVEDLPSELNTPSPTVDSHISGSSCSNTSTLDSSISNESTDPTKIIVNPINSNSLACNAITSKLSDIAEVAESLDTVIRNIQQNSQTVAEVEVESNPSPSDKKLSTLRSTSSEDWHSRSTEDDSFATASEGNFTPHSHSSASFQTASGRTSSYISCDKSSFDASEADDSTFAFEMPELTSPLNMSFEESEQSYISAQQLNCDRTVEDHEQTPTKLSESGGSQTLNPLEEDQNSIADIEDIHSESVTPTPHDLHEYHVDSIPIESETELEVAGISDAPSMEILTETSAMPMSRTPEVSSSNASDSAACSNQPVLNSDGPPSNEQNTNKPNAAWRRSKYYENITKQTIKGFL